MKTENRGSRTREVRSHCVFKLPFGEELFAGTGGRTTAQGYPAPNTTGLDGTRQKFTSKERDIETGLDYFLARYYSSTQGRFTSPDEFTGGPHDLSYSSDTLVNPTFYADIFEPQSFNKYQYCYNNPLRFVDPDGHQPGAVAEALNNAANQTQGIPVVGPLVRGAAAVAVGGGLIIAGVKYMAEHPELANAAASCPAGIDCVNVNGPRISSALDPNLYSKIQGGAQGQQQGEQPGSSSKATPPGDEKPPLGSRGTQTTSTTVGKGQGWRVDVENPNPGQRPGQIHYQSGNKKYLYNPNTKSFVGASKSENRKLLSDSQVQGAIKKGLKVLGEN